MNATSDKYLIFTIGTESYGSPLLTIREVLEYQKPKFMPNMSNHFSGVVNVRGAIVGVVDLRSKFGLPSTIDRKTAMLLCDTQAGPLAAVVDRIESVIAFTDGQVERKPPVQARIEQDYLLGVGKVNDKLVTLIDLNKSLSNENLKAA